MGVLLWLVALPCWLFGALEILSAPGRAADPALPEIGRIGAGLALYRGLLLVAAGTLCAGLAVALGRLRRIARTGQGGGHD